ncbi:MAG: hypothetical protein ACE14P_05785 [Methanotrichaceae archaeon]
MRLAYSLVLIFVILPAAASTSWGDSVSGNLHWGENLSLDGYRLVLADFSKESTQPAVLLKLYRESTLVMQQPLSQGENFTFNDNVVAEVDGITIPFRSEGYEEPSAEVRLGLYASPNVQLHLIADKEAYEPGEEIRLSLMAENQGTEDAENIRINLSSQPEQFHFTDGISVLNAGNSTYFGEGDEQKWIRLKAPLLPGYKTFQVRAVAEYFGKDGKEHLSKVYCIFRVAGLLMIHKSVEETMLPGRSYPVILSLRNLGTDIVTLDLADSITDEFQTDTGLKWNLSLVPEQTKTISYMIKPKRPGAGLVLPSAAATYNLGKERYEIRSEAPSVDVFGPFLEVNRQISSSAVNPGDKIEVSTEIANKGNRTVRVLLNESIPGWARFEGGKTRLSKLLSPGEAAYLSYRLSCDRPGSYVLPETTALYIDARGDRYNVSSPGLQIVILEDKPPAKAVVEMAHSVQHNISADNGSSPSVKGSSKIFDSLFSLLGLSAAFLILVYLIIEKLI